jgi:hypothetical protein
MCESKLRTLVHAGSVTIDNEIKGLYEFFNEDNENGQLFKCTYMSGWSESALCNVIIYEKEIDYVYHYDEAGNKIEEEKTFYNDTLLDVTFDEIPPLVDEETYQVVGLTVIDTEEEVKRSETGTNLYESAFTRYQYAWWNCEKVNEDEIKNFVCGDGEAIGKNNDEKYRNITILSSIENMITNKEFGDYYYFLARFDNGISEPLDVKGSGGTINSIKIPYKVDCPVNIVEYDDGTITYDVVTEIDDSTSKDGYITIRYSKGVTSGATEKTGISYEEKITYLKDAVEYSAIDGAYLSEIIVNKLLLNESEVDVYSEEYKLTRKCNLASIIGMEVGTQWTKDAAIDALLITKDGYEGLYWEPKYNVDIIYNRGNASAWEKRFKLTECNTMEDLTNYGNNFFNL